MHRCIGGICMTFLHCVFSNASSSNLPHWLHLCGFFSIVCLQMSPQMGCLRGFKVTLVAFVWLCSTVCFQMFPQIACLRGCIVTLVAFIRLLSTVCLQMSPQIACPIGYIVALVALVWLFISGINCCIHHSCLLQTEASLRFGISFGFERRKVKVKQV